MPRGRKLSLAAALAAGVAVYAMPEPIATVLRAEPRPLSTAEAAIPIPPLPDDAPETAAAAPAVADDAALPDGAESAEASPAEQAADPVQLADAAPFAGTPRSASPDEDWRITVTVGAADRCALTAGDDCNLLAIRYRAWDFSIELGENDDEPLIPAATPVEVEGDAEAPRVVGLPASTEEPAAAPAPRVIAPPPALGRIPALRMAPPSPSFAVTPPPAPEEPRRRSWWRSSRPAVQVAPNAYLDVANVVGNADPPRQVRGSDGALAHFEGGAQVAETPRVRFGLSIPLETLARNREHRSAAPPPPGFGGGAQN